MKVTGAVAVVTGGAGGIGRALGAELTSRGARVLLADISPAVTSTAQELGCSAWQGNCASTAGIAELLDAASQLGPVDLFFANAGIMGASGLGDDAGWDAIFDVNVRAHIRAAQALIPGWTARGRGHFVATASAAGLLTQIGQAGYSVTKHAAVGFAEWLAITYGGQGVKVSCVCPMGVNTAMLQAGAGAAEVADRVSAAAVTAAGQVHEPDHVATVVLDGVERDDFLILPHPEVLDMWRMKGSDYARWIAGMQRYQATLTDQIIHEDSAAKDSATKDSAIKNRAAEHSATKDSEE